MRIQVIMKWIGNLIIGFLVMALMISIFSMIQYKRIPNYIPSFLGFKPMSVMSGSMRPYLEPGDMIIVKEKDFELLEIGDVVTYRNDQNILITHRISGIIEDQDQLLFQTRGDANNTVDQSFVSTEQIIGFVAFHIPKGGYIVHFIRSPLGITVLIILPLILLLAGEIKAILLKKGKEENHPELENNMEI